MKGIVFTMDTMYAVIFTSIMFAILYTNLLSTYPIQRDNTSVQGYIHSLLAAANDMDVIDSPSDLNNLISFLPAVYDFNILYSDGVSIGSPVPNGDVISIEHPFFKGGSKWVRVSIWKKE